MEESDSKSHGQVFWGPLTVKEMKEILSFEKPPEMIDRRATISTAEPSRTIYSDSLTTDYLIKKQFFGNATDELCVSFTSEYFTPNETLHNDNSVVQNHMHSTSYNNLQTFNQDDQDISIMYSFKGSSECSPKSDKDNIDTQLSYEGSTPSRDTASNDKGKENFIEKISKALNLSNLDSSTYASATEGFYSKSHLNDEEPKISLNDIGKDNRESRYVDRETITILLSSDDDDNDDQNISKVYESTNSRSIPEIKNENHVDSDVVYVISDDDVSYEEQIQIKNEVEPQSNQLSIYENAMEIIDFEVGIPNTSVAEEPCNDHDSTGNMLCYQNSSEIISDGKLNSSRILKSSDVKSRGTDESLQLSSDYGFNDTLDEMEMALKNGLDYTMPDDINISQSDVHSADGHSPDYFQGPEFFQRMNSGDEFDKLNLEPTKISKLKPNNDKTKKTLIPIKSHTNLKPDKIISPLKTPAKDNFDFKVPLKPPVIRKTPDFKDILSPVAVYIKNSPKVPLVQHISAKPFVTGGLFQKPTSSKMTNKENEDLNLPSRVYKPAKHNITSKVKEQKLPRNIKKHLLPTPDIIKHQGRLKDKQTDVASVEEKLLNEDLTICCSDISVVNSSSSSLQDLSLLMTKKAYIN